MNANEMRQRLDEVGGPESMTDEIPKHHVPLPVPRRPKRVLLDLASVCNLRCPMCSVWGSEDEVSIDSVKGTMRVDAARRLLDEMIGTDVMIQPSMWAEPLLAPDIRSRFIDMKQRGLTVAMNTNGLALTDELAAFFVEIKLDSVFVSIDAVTKSTLKRIRGISKLYLLQPSRTASKLGRRAAWRA